MSQIMYVSIHAPWEGCDCTEEFRGDNASVSIHAPWEGCDSSDRVITVW